MKTSTHLIKRSLGFELSRQRALPCFGEVRERNFSSNRNICLRKDYIYSNLSFGSISMGAELARARNGIETVVRSSIKSRSVKAQASAGGDVEDLTPINPQGKSSGTVLPFVGVACLGVILFGYLLGVVNGALEYLAKDLDIAENTVLQGWVVSMLLAGGTVGSFPGEHWQTSLEGQGFSNWMLSHLS